MRLPVRHAVAPLDRSPTATAALGLPLCSSCRRADPTPPPRRSAALRISLTRPTTRSDTKRAMRLRSLPLRPLLLLRFPTPARRGLPQLPLLLPPSTATLPSPPPPPPPPPFLCRIHSTVRFATSRSPRRSAKRRAAQVTCRGRCFARRSRTPTAAAVCSGWCSAQSTRKESRQ